MGKLTAKQARFCAEYLIDSCGGRAAVRAGFSAHSADGIACRLLRKPQVAAELARLRAQLAERLQLDAERVLRPLLEILEVDLGDVFDEGGSVRPLKELAPALRRTLSSIEVEELDGRVGRAVKVRSWDKVRAAELLGKHLRLWTDKSEVTGSDGQPLVVEIRKLSGDAA